MTVGQLSLQSRVPASTIRYWERVGVLPKPARISGQRRYTSEALHRLAVLRLAQVCGFGLEDMRQLVREFCTGVSPSSRWYESGGRKQAEIDRQVARLQAMRQIVNRMMQCKCTDWNECGRLAASVLNSVPA